MPILDVIDEGRVPVKLWTPAASLEAGARAQLVQTSKLPFLFSHVAVMPDVHFGIGATVGSVVATRGAVCPAMVGVDIGCGMFAVRTPFRADEVGPKTAELRRRIERAVPTGFATNGSPTATVEAWDGWATFDRIDREVTGRRDTQERAMLQLGTLGGGNHFIEVSRDGEGLIWAVLHSGSRHLGLSIAKAYLARAQERCVRERVELPHRDLAWLPTDEPGAGRDYLRDMAWAQGYAWANREEMMRRVLREVAEVAAGTPDAPRTFSVHCHHNYAAMERHFDREVLVTRKGAVRAGAGEYGIIPGSMGTKTYITKGRGSPESFASSSHGAGRRMSRGEAKRRFNSGDVRRQTEGVDCRTDVVDEIPAAYKDLDEVMGYQDDLVETVYELKQLLCVKGGKDTP